jgi:hypothetical protein
MDLPYDPFSQSLLEVARCGTPLSRIKFFSVGLCVAVTMTVPPTAQA